MDFQVNGETYFVTLGENDKQWLVYVATPAGSRLVPVYDDASEFDDLTVVIDEKRREVVN